MYSVKCDKCGKIIEKDLNSIFWSDEKNIVEETAKYLEWDKIKEKHFCPNCSDVVDLCNSMPKNVSINKRIIGDNFLHNHPGEEKFLELDTQHVIIDRDDWEEVLKYFRDNKIMI